MFEWQKRSDNKHISSVSCINDMEETMNQICTMLSNETKTFKASDFFEEVYKYINEKNRLLYTNVTNYIFTLNDEQFGTLQTNIDSVVSYMHGEQFKTDFSKRMKKEYDEVQCEKIKMTILKLWDHVNLARRQYLLFSQKNSDYQKIVDEKMENAGTKISKEMNMQLISLISIFTALSFLLFGGLSSLDNILDGAKDIPILKLLIIGNTWCFCIINMIFVFIFFVAKLTKLNIKSTDDVNANSIQKYPYVWWCNWILCSFEIVFAWIYYLKRRQLLCVLEEQIIRNIWFVIGVSAVIGVIILVACGYIIFQANKTNNTK